MRKMIDSIEFGTVEHGIIERKCYIKETQPEEPETIEQN